MPKINLSATFLWLLALAGVLLTTPVNLHADDGVLPETILSSSEIGYPPFCVVDEHNQADGFSVELLRAALKEMGHEVSFWTGPWEKVKQSLVDREIRVLPLVGRTPEREAVFDFTFPYMTLHGTIVLRNDEDQIKSLDDLQGRRIAVMAGDNAEEFVRRQNLGASMSSTTSFKEALLELSQGKHDAVIIQKLLYVQLLNELDISNLKMVGPPLQEFKQSFCFAVAKGDADLLGILNEGLSIVMVDGTFQNLREKWFASLEEPARSRIVVGGDFNYPPYEYLDENGEPAGYNVELTKAIARHLGLQVDFKLGPWAEIREKLANKEIDIVQDMFYSSERDKNFDFTDHHALVSHVAVVRAGTEIPSSLADLAGKTIVVMRGDILHDQALKAGFSEHLILAQTQQEVLQILSSGRGDCALIARLPAMYWIQKDNLSNLSVGEKSFATSELCYASYQGNQDLVERFSLALSNLKATGEYREIHNKWLGIYQQPGLSSWMVIKYILIVTIPILLLLLAVFVWSQSLKKQVRLRTRDLEAEVLERKQAEQALRDSEAKQRAMVENILDVIAIIGKDGAIRFTSPNIEKWLGWRPEERIGDSPWESIHPEDRDHARKVFADLLEKPGLSATIECRYRRKDGSYEWIEFSGINRLQDPNIAGILINYHIITERKRSEEILKESEERFRLLVENAPDAIFARNKRGCFTYLNKAAIALFGATSAQELIGTPIIERYHPKVRETLLRRMQIINEEQLAAPLRQTICLQLNGNEVNVETTAVPMHYMGEDGALVFMRDITDRIEQQKRQQSLEKQLLQSQKLESVGILAGGIAHDFNNVLTGLYGNLALAKMKLANDHPGVRFLEAAEQSMLRTTLLTNRLLTFAKGGDPVTESLSLVSPIEEVVNLNLSGSNVKPVITSATNLWQVRVDQRQIQQVFANLTINAREAMPNGGHLYITMENAELADKTEHGLIGGKCLQITVTDEGTGIDPELLDKIFDPYFSTKEMGSGLGLATAYSIIAKHGGQISVASQLGKGTTFTIYLPVTEVAEETPLTPHGVTQESLTQGAKILVMDDEEMIRNMLNEMLGELGFAVETAVEGQQAIDMYRQAMESGKPFAIVILDLTIPGGMGGQEAAKGILQIDPEAKMIVSSGYADDPLTANYADYGFKGAATKPYSMNKLSGVLDQVMKKD